MPTSTGNFVEFDPVWGGLNFAWSNGPFLLTNVSHSCKLRSPKIKEKRMEKEFAFN